jgi:hypothetical protein
VVINQLFQFRMYGRSIIENWGHSVTVLGGPAAQLPAGWWMNWDTDVPDVMDAAEMANAMVNDLDAADNPMPWLEFMSTGQFAQSYLIYSAGDADRYNLPRLILNRQSEYVVAYRPDRASAWDWIRIAPSYNLEWNDVAAKLEEIHGLTFNGKLDKNGVPIDGSDQVLKEFERSGFANAPNPDLDQIVFYDSDGQLLYAMTVRAFVGANDSLIMFGARQPVYDRDSVALTDNITRPVNYGADGKPVPETDLERQARDEQWLEFQKEGSFWHFLKDNPSSVSADLFVQYRFRDNTSWAPIKCTDSDGNEYTCGYDPVEWKLLTTYYLDGKVRRPWLIMQLLGEVGVRSLGVSYASGRSEGTGILFAMGQLLLRDEYRDGMTQESIWRLDARASQLPATLAEAWREVHLAPGR